MNYCIIRAKAPKNIITRLAWTFPAELLSGWLANKLPLGSEVAAVDDLVCEGVFCFDDVGAVAKELVSTTIPPVAECVAAGTKVVLGIGTELVSTAMPLAVAATTLVGTTIVPFSVMLFVLTTAAGADELLALPLTPPTVLSRHNALRMLPVMADFRRPSGSEACRQVMVREEAKEVNSSSQADEQTGNVVHD